MMSCLPRPFELQRPVFWLLALAAAVVPGGPARSYGADARLRLQGGVDTGGPAPIARVLFSPDISVKLEKLGANPGGGFALNCSADDPVAQSFSATGCQQVSVGGPSFLKLNPGSRGILYPTSDCSGPVSLPVVADTNLCSVSYSDGSAVNDNVGSVLIQAGLVNDEDIASDNFNATPDAYWPLPALPAGTAITAYHRLPGGVHIFGLESAAALPGGVTARPPDLVSWSAGGGFRILATIGPTKAKFDALTATELPNGILFSLDVDITIEGTKIADEDLFDEEQRIFFDGSAAGIDPALDLDAAHFDNRSRHLFVSFDGSGTVGGISFSDEDLLEWDVVTSAWVVNPNTATGVAYDGSARDSDWRAADLKAVFLEMEVVCPDPTSISVGSSMNGQLARTDCASALRPGSLADNYLLSLPSSQSLTIDLRSTSFDAFLTVLDESGNALFMNDDERDGVLDSRLILTLDAGVYVIEASSFVFGTGDYTLSIAGAPEPPSITRLTPNSAVAGSPDLDVTISGENFCPASVAELVVVEGAPLPASPLATTFVNSSELTAKIPAASLERPTGPNPSGPSRNLSIQVSNPLDPPDCPLAGTSERIVFQVRASATSACTPDNLPACVEELRRIRDGLSQLPLP